MFTPHEPPPRARDIGRIPFPRLTPWAGPSQQDSVLLATPSPLHVSTPITPGQPAQQGASHLFRACYYPPISWKFPVSRGQHACPLLYWLSMLTPCRGRCQASSAKRSAPDDGASRHVVIKDLWPVASEAKTGPPHPREPAKA